MPSYLLLGALALIAYKLADTLISWRRNIAAAQASGLPYLVVPVFVFGRGWLVLNRPVVRALKRLPKSIRPVWAERIAPDHSWDHLFTPFANLESATYMTVSPGGCMLWTGNAEVIAQITQRRNDFPKPSTMYRSVNIFGRNVVSAEGQLWRRHRKITSPPFTERNNHLVWAESIHQAESMVKDWTGMEGNDSRTLTAVAHDCMRLSLHIISRAGFGVRLLWPGIETPDPASEQGGVGQGLEQGHSMTYTQALETLLHNILIVVGMPHWLLRNLPFQRTKEAYQSFIEWGKYMNEMMEAKKIQVSSGDDDDGGLDLMGALVRNAGYGNDSKAEKGQGDTLTDDEILGNAFVFILAGHETTANTIHYALAFLAMHLKSQRNLQVDLDQIFQGRKPSDWNYDQDLPKLFGGMTGAVMNETLRLIPPVINIPKTTVTEQKLTVDGKEVTIPGKSLVNLTTIAVHRNPRYWPTGPPPADGDHWHPSSNHDNDLNEFRPERWILSGDAAAAAAAADAANAAKTAETEDLGVNTAADTASTLFRPARGAYVPFSEGYRSCIGRRFAQVEVLAVLAVLMSQWSVELAVDQWASDAEVAAMSPAERETLWRKARANVRETLRTKMGTIITIQLRKGAYVPLRFVRRGKERFDF